MTKPDRLPGLPLLQAIMEMQGELHQQIIAAGFRSRFGPTHRMDPDDIERVQPLLWGWIKERIYASELTANGVRDGEDEARSIPTSFINAATPHYDKSALTTGAMTYHGVRIAAAHTRQPMQSRKAGRPSSYPLYVAEMRMRHDRGEMEVGVGAQARYLESWLAQKHKDQPPAGASRIETRIRDEHATLKSTPKK